MTTEIEIKSSTSPRETLEEITLDNNDSKELDDFLKD